VKDTADLVNLIIGKLGGNRVEFIRIDCADDVSTIEFVHAGNLYSIVHDEDDLRLKVWQYYRDQGPLEQNNYSKWMEGVLNGMVRNEAGELLPA
jgi:hypothetical protein